MRDEPGSELGGLFMAIVLVLGRNGRLSDPKKVSWHGGDEKLMSIAWELDTVFCLLKGEVVLCRLGLKARSPGLRAL